MLDILLVDLLSELDYAAAAEASRRIFRERATHEFPPGIVFPREWYPELESLAKELEFPITTPAAIEVRFRDVVGKLRQAGGS